MEITLRKANAIQREIKSVMSTLGATAPTVELNTFTNINDIEGMTETLRANIESLDILRMVLYNIRKSVSTANHVSGINDLLADVAYQTEGMKSLEGIALGEVMPSMGEIDRRIDASGSDKYQYSGMRVSIVPAVMVEKAKNCIAVAKREKISIQDKLLNMNITTTITLSDETVEVLRSHTLV